MPSTRRLCPETTLTFVCVIAGCWRARHRGVQRARLRSRGGGRHDAVFDLKSVPPHLLAGQYGPGREEVHGAGAGAGGGPGLRADTRGHARHRGPRPHRIRRRPQGQGLRLQCHLLRPLPPRRHRKIPGPYPRLYITGEWRARRTLI